MMVIQDPQTLSGWLFACHQALNLSVPNILCYANKLLTLVQKGKSFASRCYTTLHRVASALNAIVRRRAANDLHVRKLKPCSTCSGAKP